MELETMVWPYSFGEATVDRSQAGAKTGGDYCPWLLGVDGKYRGEVKTFDGFRQYDRLPGTSRKQGIVHILIAANWTAGDTVIIADRTFTATAGVPAAMQFQIGGTCLTIATSLGAAITADASNFNTVVVGGSAYFAWVTFNFVGASSTNTFTMTTAVAGAGAIDPSSNSTRTAAGNFQTALTGLDLDVTYMKYVEMLNPYSGLTRGYILRVGDRLIFAYRDNLTSAGGGSTWNNYWILEGGDTVSPNWSEYRISVTYSGRVIYISGVKNGASVAKVLYWHPVYGIMVLRDFGPKVMALTGGAVTFTINETTSATDLLGFGYYQYALRYYDSTRRRRSGISTPSGPSTAPTIFDLTKYRNGVLSVTNDTGKPLPNDYSDIEVFTTIAAGLAPSNNTLPPGGLLFRRNRIPVPTTGTTSYTLTYDMGTAGGEDQLSDESLVLLERYDPISGVVNTTVPAMQCIEFYEGAMFAAVVEDGFLNIQWSPLGRIEPENMQALNVYRTRIPAFSGAHFVQAGDFLWLLGDGESYRIQKRGASLSIHKMLEGYKFVGPSSSTVVGSTIIGVTYSGVLLVNGNTGDHQQIGALDRFVNNRWSKNLTGLRASSSKDTRERIYLAYDGRSNCVYLWNRAVGECVQLWISTNRITLLVDAWWNNLCTGRLPNDYTDAVRVFILTDFMSISGVRGGCRLIYPNDYPVTDDVGIANMIGFNDTYSKLEVTLDSATFNSPYTEIVVVTGAVTTLVGDLAGGMLYLLAGSNILTGYLIKGNTAYSAGKVTLYISGNITSVVNTVAAVPMALCPVVYGFLLGPIPSPMFADDLLSRRTVDGASVVLSQLSRGTSSTHPLIVYGLSRQDDSGDTVVKDENASVNNPLAPGSGIPWRNTWSETAGTSYTPDLSTPATGASTSSGLFADLLGDGGLLYPTLVCLKPSITLAVLGLYLTGRINPNQSVHST